MNLTHLHLLITHLPIYGSILGALILAYGILADSTHTCKAAYLVLIVSAIGGIIAYSTGESAEETVEHIAGVSKDLIEAHEESAEGTLIAIIIMGLISITGLFVKKGFRLISKITLIVTVVCFVMAARTGYLGGKIRHTEIEDSMQQSESNMDNNK